MGCRLEVIPFHTLTPADGLQAWNDTFRHFDPSRWVANVATKHRRHCLTHSNWWPYFAMALVTKHQRHCLTHEGNTCCRQLVDCCRKLFGGRLLPPTFWWQIVAVSFLVADCCRHLSGGRLLIFGGRLLPPELWWQIVAASCFWWQIVAANF